MDIFDRATECEEWMRSRALAAQAAKQPPLEGVDWKLASAKRCEAAGCGERIPEARRCALPGVKLCVQCQSERERRG